MNSDLYGREVYHVVAGLLGDAQRVLPARQRAEALGEHGEAGDGVQRQRLAPARAEAQRRRHLEPARALRTDLRLAANE